MHGSKRHLIRAEVHLVFPSPDGRKWRAAPDGYGTEHGVAEFMVTIMFCAEPSPPTPPLGTSVGRPLGTSVGRPSGTSVGRLPAGEGLLQLNFDANQEAASSEQSRAMRAYSRPGMSEFAHGEQRAVKARSCA